MQDPGISLAQLHEAFQLGHFPWVHAAVSRPPDGALGAGGNQRGKTINSLAKSEVVFSCT